MDMRPPIATQQAPQSHLHNNLTQLSSQSPPSHFQHQQQQQAAQHNHHFQQALSQQQHHHMSHLSAGGPPGAPGTGGPPNGVPGSGVPPGGPAPPGMVGPPPPPGPPLDPALFADVAAAFAGAYPPSVANAMLGAYALGAPTHHPAFGQPLFPMMPQGRRKNATRETTAPLKAWLNDHRKNPYPNKGEKILLAMYTNMTLTQVSTWFANARRRLKKENKMTWSPRNRCDDDTDDDLDDDAASGVLGVNSDDDGDQHQLHQHQSLHHHSLHSHHNHNHHHHHHHHHNNHTLSSGGADHLGSRAGTDDEDDDDDDEHDHDDDHDHDHDNDDDNANDEPINSSDNDDLNNNNTTSNDKQTTKQRHHSSARSSAKRRHHHIKVDVDETLSNASQTNVDVDCETRIPSRDSPMNNNNNEPNEDSKPNSNAKRLKTSHGSLNARQQLELQVQSSNSSPTKQHHQRDDQLATSSVSTTPTGSPQQQQQHQHHHQSQLHQSQLNQQLNLSHLNHHMNLGLTSHNAAGAAAHLGTGGSPYAGPPPAPHPADVEAMAAVFQHHLSQHFHLTGTGAGHYNPLLSGPPAPPPPHSTSLPPMPPMNGSPTSNAGAAGASPNGNSQLTGPVANIGLQQQMQLMQQNAEFLARAHQSAATLPPHLSAFHAHQHQALARLAQSAAVAGSNNKIWRPFH